MVDFWSKSQAKITEENPQVLKESIKMFLMKFQKQSQEELLEETLRIPPETSKAFPNKFPKESLKNFEELHDGTLTKKK